MPHTHWGGWELFLKPGVGTHGDRARRVWLGVPVGQHGLPPGGGLWSGAPALLPELQPDFSGDMGSAPVSPSEGEAKSFVQVSLLGKGLSIWSQTKRPTLGLVSSPTLSSYFSGISEISLSADISPHWQNEAHGQREGPGTHSLASTWPEWS